MNRAFHGTKLQRARLIDTYRGEAVLITEHGRVPVMCELSQYQTGGSRWRTGWIAGDMRSLCGDKEVQDSVLQFADHRTVRVILHEFDETGAAVEEQG